MDLREENQTKKWIIEALFHLLEQKEYHDITISQIVNQAGLGRRTFYRYFRSKDEVIQYTTQLLMDALAETFLANHVDSPTSVAKSYFEFWERHIDTLLLLKKAHLLYFIEEPLPELIHGVAEKIGHFPPELNKDDLNLLREQSKYEFAFKLAGFWSVTLLWCEEEHRKTPEEMSQLLTSNSVFMLSMPS